LAILGGVVLAKGVFLAFFIPPWDVPDERAHVMYTQAIVENHQFPVFRDQQLAFSQEVWFSMHVQGFYARHPAILPYRSKNELPPVATADTPDEARRLTQPVIANPAASYGPEYYLIQAIPYVIFRHASIEVRLIAMRLVSVILFAITVSLTYLAAFEIRKSQIFAVTVAGAMALHPMASFMSSGVNNDALAIVLSALIFYLLIRWWPEPWTVQRVLWLAVAIGLGVMVKQSTVFFIPVAVAALAYGHRHFQQSKLAVHLLLLVSVASAVGFSWSVWRALTDSEHGSLVLHAINTGSSHHPLPLSSFFSQSAVRAIAVFRSFWGMFGYLDIPFPGWVYVTFAVVCLAATAGLVLAVLRYRHGQDAWTWRNVLLCVGMLITVETMFCVLNVMTFLRNGSFELTSQGRYYFPILPALLILQVLGLEQCVPHRLRNSLYVGLLMLMALVTVYSIYPVMHRAYLSEPVSDTGYFGTWERLGEQPSRISLRRDGDGYRFRWSLDDGPQSVHCDDHGVCTEFFQGDRLYEWSFRAYREAGSEELRLERVRKSLDEDAAPLQEVDRLVVQPGGLELRAFTIERNHEKLPHSGGFYAYFKRSDRPF
jgi:uncharacterized membrane protein